MKKLYAVRDKESKRVCICRRKPKWRKFTQFGCDKGHMWLFYGSNKSFWTTVNIDIFKKLIGRNVKEGKDGLVEITNKKQIELLKKLHWRYKNN